MARYLQSKNADVRERAINRAMGVQSEEIFQLLLIALDDDERRVRDAAVDALGYFDDPRTAEKLVTLFDATEPYQDEYIDRQTGEIKIHIRHERRFSLLGLAEAVGRIGDSRALAMLTLERLKGLESEFLAPIRISWAIASIAARTSNIAGRQQAARQLIRFYPCGEKQDRYLLHRMPWNEKDMLDCVARLLADPDLETRHHAAVFLCLNGDGRGTDLLLDSLHQADILYDTIEALATIEDRRVLDSLIELLTRPNPPEDVVCQGFLILSRWSATMTEAERQKLTDAVPRMLSHLTRGDVNTFIFESIRHIGTKEANRLVDEWLAEEIHAIFESFIEHRDPSGIPDGISDLSLISRTTLNTPNTRILTHPLMRHYAFPALRARFEYLQERGETSHPDYLIATIGWLGDPQALPFLYEELQRREQEDADDLRGELIYAIANIKNSESILVLASCLNHENPKIRREAIKPVRDFVKAVPDERIIQAIIEHIGTEANDYGGLDMELIEAIGIGGSPVAVPHLVKLLPRRDFIGTEAISSLVHIAQKNSGDTELVREIVGHLAPLLGEKTIVPLNYFYQPLATMKLDAYTALALKDIGTPEALAAVEAWRHQQQGKDT